MLRLLEDHQTRGAAWEGPPLTDRRWKSPPASWHPLDGILYYSPELLVNWCWLFKLPASPFCGSLLWNYLGNEFSILINISQESNALATENVFWGVHNVFYQVPFPKFMLISNSIHSPWMKARISSQTPQNTVALINLASLVDELYYIAFLFKFFISLPLRLNTVNIY